MGYYSDFNGSIAYETIHDVNVLRRLEGFIHNGSLDTLVCLTNGYEHVIKHNQFSGNVQINAHRIEVHIAEKKSTLFKEFLQEIVNFVQREGYKVTNVYIDREGEEPGDLETFTIIGDMVSSNKSHTAQEIFGS